jgi:ATP-dependent protease ClpP protease subunit
MKTHQIKIYGIIGMEYCCASSIVGEIEYFNQMGYDITICLHSEGGDVIEGNMIANAIAKAGATIRIDGLAASMAAFILPYAAKVEMVDNGFIMLHAPRFNAGGTADELEKAIKQMREIEADFVAKLMAKTGKDKATVRTWLDGENWYTASEAKEMGLVDEIIESITTIQIEASARRNSNEIYSRFAAQLITSKNQQMDKSQIIARFGLTGVTAESSDADVLAAVESQITAEKTGRVKAEADLAVEKTARETAEATIAAEKQKELDGIVAAAITEKRITADKKDIFLNIGKSAGVDALKTAIETIPAVKPNRLSAMVNNSAAQEGESAWEKRMREIRGEKS